MEVPRGLAGRGLHLHSVTMTQHSWTAPDPSQPRVRKPTSGGVYTINCTCTRVGDGQTSENRAEKGLRWVGKSFQQNISNDRVRYTQSAGQLRPKLLFLREDGVCRPIPDEGNLATCNLSNPHRKKISGFILEMPPANALCDRVGAVDIDKNKLKPSEKRKIKYLEGVVQTCHERFFPVNARLRQSRKSRSAPLLRRNRNEMSDHLVKVFEWSKMSELRRQMRNIDVTPAVLQFRDKVKEKKNRAKRLLLVVTRIFMAIQHWSSEKSVRTAAELQWFTLNSSSEAKTLAFNKEWFTKERAQAKVPEWAVHIMGKLPANRSDKECRKLHALMRGLQSFEKFTERIQLAMCRSLRYENIESMRIVLRKGHIGLNFYFIYSGSVFINVDDVNAKGEKFAKTEVILSRGDSFGELALLQEVTRTATVSVRETCELLTVDKEVFSKLCPQIFDKELEEKIAFLQTVPLFQGKHWTTEAKRNLCFQAHIQEYKTNRVVVADSNTDDWMYICMSGKCKIIKHLYIDRVEEDGNWGEESGVLSSDVLNILSVDGEEKTDRKGRRRSSAVERKRRVSVQQDKTRLLQSMGLSYIDSNQRQDDKKQPKDEDSRKVMSTQFGLTLNTLINQTRQQAEKQDFVFLDIGTLERREIFDLESILSRKSSQSGSKFILASCGASLLRLKRRSFFQNASEECLQHAQAICAKQRFPSDMVLLKSYQEKEFWDHYKNRIVRDIISLRDWEIPQNNWALSAAERQTELEHKTERLLKAFTRKSGLTRDQSEKTSNKYPISVHLMASFILGQEIPTHKRKNQTDIDVEDESTDGSYSKEPSEDVTSRARIPTIIIN